MVYSVSRLPIRMETINYPKSRVQRSSETFGRDGSWTEVISSSTKGGLLKKLKGKQTSPFSYKKIGGSPNDRNQSRLYVL